VTRRRRGKNNLSRVCVCRIWLTSTWHTHICGCCLPVPLGRRVSSTFPCTSTYCFPRGGGGRAEYLLINLDQYLTYWNFLKFVSLSSFSFQFIHACIRFPWIALLLTWRRGNFNFWMLVSLPHVLRDVPYPFMLHAWITNLCMLSASR